MSNADPESLSDPVSIPAERGSEGSVSTSAAAQPARSESGPANGILTHLRQFFWLDEKIANASAKYLGPSQLGWREYELAKDARDAIEDLRNSGENQYSLALLLRAQLLLLIRCHCLRNGIDVYGDAFAVADWEVIRKVPQIDALHQNLSAANLVHVQSILAENPEPYLVRLEPTKLKGLDLPLREMAAALTEPLEREANIVNRLMLVRYARLVVAAALLFVALAYAFGWFTDKSGTKNLARNRPVTVSSQIEGVGTDHRLLVDGDTTNIGFHTDTLPNQFVVIDLGSSVKFDKVVVYNRSDCCKERAVPLRLEVSDDNANYNKLAERTDEFDVWTASRLRAQGRFVRLRLLTKNAFHLAEVEVY